LTLRERRSVKAQDVGAQVRVKRDDRLKIIKMDAEREAPAAPAADAAGETK
jgi:NADH-quinone oxidoreductase subunit J